MNQMSITSLINTMVPITRFNRGEASKIFEEVEKSGCKIVVKNNKPSCVLLSLEKYESLIEMLSDYTLMLEAQERLERCDDSGNLTHEEMMKELGISEADLSDIDVELE